MLLSCVLYAQEFEVRSFSNDPNDISAIRYPKKDVNNQPAAIIKVRTSLNGLNFECNSGFVGDPEFKDGEIWLYVSPRERRLKFMKEGFMTTDYIIKEVIEPSCVYVIELVNKFQAPIKAGASLGFIVIKSQPSGAQVKINGDATGTATPFQKPLIPGQYSFELMRTLYQTYSGTFIIVAGKTITEEITLEPNFGSLSISTTPEQGASIYIDDELEEQTTPATFDQIPSGSHIITVLKKYYETVTQNFIIQNGERTELNIKLQSTSGIVEITAPEDVEIWIDQQQVGRGDYYCPLVKGVHLIEGKAANYTDFSETVTVEVGQKHPVTVNMIPETGSLTVMTEPMEVDVFIDGENRGKSPIVIESLIIGDHTIRLEKEGYGDLTKQITLQENQTLEIKQLSPKGDRISTKSVI
ncbi:MAG: PEGA domain-containing protein [Bacteroidetes bacterium]|nr:PEGA domain-containing protein [Bacteroidota bacterium]